MHSLNFNCVYVCVCAAVTVTVGFTSLMYIFESMRNFSLNVTISANVERPITVALNIWRVEDTGIYVPVLISFQGVCACT